MTATYELYVESGPKRRKTMVHVFDLLGCVAVGPTTGEAIAVTPAAIRAYRRFLVRHGRACSPDEPFETRVAEHITEGDWLGNGSPYITFGPDLDPMTAEEVATYLYRFAWLREELADWAETQRDADLDAPPAGGGRTARAVLLHVLGAAYLASILGSAPGFSALHGAAERRELSLAEALRQGAALAAKHVNAAPVEVRSLLREHPTQGPRTLRRALRRTLEHDWEHRAELARRPGGPSI